METVSIQVPAALYSALFERFGESTSSTITSHLGALLNGGGGAAPQVNQVIPAYSRPRAGTITGRVWEIADEIQKKSGRADREAVIKACMAEKININTASTQFSYWRKANP